MLAARRRPRMPSFQRLRGSNPLELHIVGRTLWHAALVGLAAGFVGTVFVAALDLVQRVVLEQGVGYTPLRAAGEEVLPSADAPAFRWWLLLFLPALGSPRLRHRVRAARPGDAGRRGPTRSSAPSTSKAGSSVAASPG